MGSKKWVRILGMTNIDKNIKKIAKFGRESLASDTFCNFLGEVVGIQSRLVLPHNCGCRLARGFVELGLSDKVSYVFWPGEGNNGSSYT